MLEAAAGFRLGFMLGVLDPPRLITNVLHKMSSLELNPLRWSVDWNNLPQMDKLLMWFPLLGPQRRIYQDLVRQLKARHQDVEPWERLGPEVRDAARRVTQILKDHLGWPASTVFLPEDPADIPFWDRTGDLAGTEAILAVEEAFLVEMPEDFWLSLPKITFGQAITKLLQATKAEPSASPNGGPARLPGNSGVSGGPIGELAVKRHAMKAAISNFCHSASYLAVVLTAIASLIWLVSIATGDRLTQAAWLLFVPWVGGAALALGLIPSSILFVQSHKPRDLWSIWMSGVSVLVVTVETAALYLFR